MASNPMHMPIFTKLSIFNAHPSWGFAFQASGYAFGYDPTDRLHKSLFELWRDKILNEKNGWNV